MQRIPVDFNTLNSEPIDKLKLGHEGASNGDALPPLEPGERVLFYKGICRRRSERPPHQMQTWYDAAQAIGILHMRS